MTTSLAAVALAFPACSSPTPWRIDVADGGGVPSPRYLHAAADQLVDRTGQPVQLRCENLGAWLHPEAYLLGEGALNLLVSASELRARLANLVGADPAIAFWSAYRAGYVTADDFAQLHRLGFNCVRVPFEWRSLVGDPARPDAPLLAGGLAPLDDAVRWAAQEDMYVILDLHTAPGGQSEAASVSDVPSNDVTPRLFDGPTATANQAQLVSVWRQLAAHFASAAAVGGYDLMNEPDVPGDVSPTALPAIYAEVIAAIRQVDPDHLVITEGDKQARDFSAFPAPLDPNQVYSFHAYFTATDEASIAPYVALRNRDHLPLWLGEFGENSLEWQHAMVHLVETEHIGWALWTYKRRVITGYPAAAVFTPPAAWGELLTYLVSPELSRRPTPAEAASALAALLDAIATSRCQLEQGLLDELTAA